jgi:hypothetical protein
VESPGSCDTISAQIRTDTFEWAPCQEGTKLLCDSNIKSGLRISGRWSYFSEYGRFLGLCVHEPIAKGLYLAHPTPPLLWNCQLRCRMEGRCSLEEFWNRVQSSRWR